MNTQTYQFRPELYATYLTVLARIQLRAAGPLQNKVNASDIVQEALMQAVVALPQFKGTTDQQFAAWLRAILANKFTDAARHFGRMKRNLALEESYCETLSASSERLHKLIPANQTSPSEHLMRHERLSLIADALCALPDDQRTAVELHHLAGLSLLEIARQTNRSRASVAGLLRRGLKALHESLERKELDLR